MSQKEQCFELRKQGLSHREIAAELGLNRGTIHTWLNKNDPAVQAAMNAVGTELVPSNFWAKTQKDGSTTYSVQLRPEKNTGPSIEELKEAFKGIPQAPKIPSPRYTLRDQVTLYPLFDVHLGLRAEANITGEDVDVASTKGRLTSAVAELVATAPASELAIIANGGDFTHADDDENATPANKHTLDVACRNFTTVTEAVDLIASLIEMALKKHRRVKYVSVPGNHDPKNWVTLMVGLYYRYQKHQRVEIELTPIEIAFVEFGETLVAIHHGHKKKNPRDLVAFFAAEYPEVWGRTRRRYLFTGHDHNWSGQRFPGMYWERFEPVTSRDHYAASSLYDQASSVSCITYSKEGGEIGRVRKAL